MKGLSERANGATLALIVKQNLKPIHDMNRTPQAPAQRNARIYVLHRFPPVASAVVPALPKASVTPTGLASPRWRARSGSLATGETELDLAGVPVGVSALHCGRLLCGQKGITRARNRLVTLPGSFNQQ